MKAQDPNLQLQKIDDILKGQVWNNPELTNAMQDDLHSLTERLKNTKDTDAIKNLEKEIAQLLNRVEISKELAETGKITKTIGSLICQKWEGSSKNKGKNKDKNTVLGIIIDALPLTLKEKQEMLAHLEGSWSSTVYNALKVAISWGSVAVGTVAIYMTAISALSLAHGSLQEGEVNLKYFLLAASCITATGIFDIATSVYRYAKKLETQLGIKLGSINPNPTYEDFIDALENGLIKELSKNIGDETKRNWKKITKITVEASQWALGAALGVMIAQDRWPGHFTKFTQAIESNIDGSFEELLNETTNPQYKTPLLIASIVMVVAFAGYKLIKMKKSIFKKQFRLTLKKKLTSNRENLHRS